MTPVRVGLGQLGEVADAHEHLGVRVAAAHLEVAAEARREARADRLDDRVDEVRLAEPLEVGDRRVEAVEVLGRVGDQHRRRPQALGEVPVGAVEAEHVVDARLVGHEDLVGVERVDAQREAGARAARRSSPGPSSSQSRPSESPRSMTSAPASR